ncbi:hypothetical protein [Methylocystis sp. Sn-Cys]|uniref:hypothetical protein n=1 Tax=Methylocystis sp. Sn-Cys TaxID=1701263 RepID=UPI001923AB2C|nr:hypothetical protein [Methylocystis sp. Sn-Cys]MBL1256848.1 hypothetical protein [Methylocystis sp. Sn-Cys]
MTTEFSNNEDNLKSKLKPFLDRHADSKVSTAKLATQEHVIIENPWSDESVIILLKDESDDIVGILNRIILPQRFSALYHIEDKRLELIYTAYPLKSQVAQSASRSFKFNFGDKEYVCEFKTSSNSLLEIAGASRPFGESTTQHRNLQSFNTYSRTRKDMQIATSTPLGEPISFWINDIEWDEDYVVQMAMHLNFYMLYFDRSSPFILIHPPKATDSIASSFKRREPTESFPSVISGRKMDDILLQFWHGCISGNSFTKFLNAYRILEYSSFFYMEERLRSSIRKALASPDAFGNLDRVVDKISSTIGADRLKDSQRLSMLCKECLCMDRLWGEIENNKDVFSSDCVFDGGFTSPRLVNNGWKRSDFETNGIDTVAQALRNVRNALSHGKDQATALCITPTHHNMLRLRPWSELARTVAEDVMVYKKYMV